MPLGGGFAPECPRLAGPARRSTPIWGVDHDGAADWAWGSALGGDPQLGWAILGSRDGDECGESKRERPAFRRELRGLGLEYRSWGWSMGCLSWSGHRRSDDLSLSHDHSGCDVNEWVCARGADNGAAD